MLAVYLYSRAFPEERFPKERLAMRPMVSATQTYSYALAKWLDTKLKPLSLNRYTVTDIF